MSELYPPAAGIVLARNEAVLADPSLVNSDPYGQGWLYRLQYAEASELTNATAYGQLTGGQS